MCGRPLSQRPPDSRASQLPQVKQEAAAPALAAQQPQQGGWHAGPHPAELQGGFPGYDGASAGRGMQRIESNESSLHTGGASGGHRGVKRDSADTVEDDEVSRR